MTLMRHPGRTRLILVGATLLLLVACGGGQGSSGGGDEDVTPSKAPSTKSGPTVSASPEPFCDKLDRAAVAELLGLRPGKVKVTFEVSPGEKLDPNGTLTAEYTECVLGSDQERVALYVYEEKAGSVRINDQPGAKIRLIGSSEGRGATCAPIDDRGFGQPSWGAGCNFKADKYGELEIEGVFGTTVVGCYRFTVKDRDDLESLTKPSVSFCLDAVDAIAG